MLPIEEQWMEPGEWEGQATTPTVITALEPVQELAARLSGGGMYTRTAILLLPHGWVGREDEVAVRLGMGYVDYRAWKLSHLHESQTFLLYSADRLIAELDDVSAESHPFGSLLISLLDLPLSALAPDQRQTFWNFLFGAFSKRLRALLVALPEEANNVLPAHTADTWREAERLVSWTA